MDYVLASLVVVAFALGLHLLRLASRGREVWTRVKDSLEILRDPDLDDDAKEQAFRRQSVAFVVLVGWLVGGSVLALGLPLLGVWVLELAGFASLSSVLSALEDPVFLTGTVVVGGVAYLIAGAATGP